MVCNGWRKSWLAAARNRDLPTLAFSASDFAVSAGDSTLKVDSSVPLGKSRPILIIVDPGSYSRTELRRRLSLLSAALADPTASGQEPVPLRLGFPILDGVLTDTITDRKFLGKRLDSAIESFLPAGPESETGNLGRFLDLVAELVRRSEEAGGPVDWSMRPTRHRVNRTRSDSEHPLNRRPGTDRQARRC